MVDMDNLVNIALKCSKYFGLIERSFQFSEVNKMLVEEEQFCELKKIDTNGRSLMSELETY